MFKEILNVTVGDIFRVFSVQIKQALKSGLVIGSLLRVNSVLYKSLLLKRTGSAYS